MPPHFVIKPKRYYQLSIIDINGRILHNIELSDLNYSIDVSGLSILSLTGLKSFTNLSSLDASNNLISSIDLINNTYLNSLNLASNRLQSMDLTSHIYLKSLQLQNNAITSLDLSNNSVLTTVNVSSNELTSLNIKNKANGLTTYFNSSLNGSLSCILVDNVTFSNEHWTLKDTASNFSETSCNETLTYIPDDIFENYLESQSLGNGVANDNYVDTSKIAAVVTLSLNHLYIQDLTGIESFTDAVAAF